MDSQCKRCFWNHGVLCDTNPKTCPLEHETEFRDYIFDDDETVEFPSEDEIFRKEMNDEYKH